jgi:hypothetical protein
LDPVILFFILGLVAGLAKSDLRLPPAIYDLLSTLLLITIVVLLNVVAIWARARLRRRFYT